MARVLVCDDHVTFAEALAVVLRGGGHSVTPTTTARDALAHAAAEPFDVVVMDLGLPGAQDGLGATRALVAAHPRLRVLLLTASADRRLVARAVDAGAEGVATKDQPLAAVLRAVAEVEAGGFYCAPHLLREALRPPSPATDLAHLTVALLTPREREVLARLVQGATTPQMAEAMGIGPATVRTHVQAVLTKLGVGSRLEAVVHAVAHGLVEGPAHPAPTGWG